jgi:mono/diheme cytochrome c family protein
MIRTSYMVLTLMASLVATASGKERPRQYFALPRAEGTDMHNAGRNERWEAPKAAAQRSNPIPPSRASVARGREVYQKYCMSCHGKSGRGNGPAGAALTPRPSNLKESAEEHSAGDLTWKGILTESEIWDLVNYIKSLKKAHRDCKEAP